MEWRTRERERELEREREREQEREQERAGCVGSGGCRGKWRVGVADGE